MKNSYNDSATSDVPSHLFEWAVSEDDSAHDVASRLIIESASATLEKLDEQKQLTEHLNAMSDFGVSVVDELERAGFVADFEVLPESKVKFSFDDDGDVFDRRRMRLAENVIGAAAAKAGGVQTKVNIMEYANGGEVTVGMIPGSGFGKTNTYDPYAKDNVRRVTEIDANIDAATLDKIEELVTMWDSDADVYNEGVDIVLNRMSSNQRSKLKLWVESQFNRVGVPGTRLEEVLHDMHYRIRHRNVCESQSPTTSDVVYKRDYKGDWYRNGRFVKSVPDSVLRSAKNMAIECEITIPARRSRFPRRSRNF